MTGRGLPVQTCSHVLCNMGACRLEAIGPELPSYVKDADGQHWSRFGNLYYRHVSSKLQDVVSWRELHRRGRVEAVDFSGRPDRGAVLLERVGV